MRESLCKLFEALIDCCKQKKEDVMSMMSEFKEFAVKGNAIDMAVGIVVGAAFGTVVTSLVSDIIMPPIGMLLGGVNFTDLSIVLSEATADTAAVAINYGNFMQTVLDFLIVAWAIFLVVKGINRLKKNDK